MLRHAFGRLEGGNILWHIVGPLPSVPPIFHPLYFFACLVGILPHEAKPRVGKPTNKGKKIKRVKMRAGRGKGTHNLSQYLL